MGWLSDTKDWLSDKASSAMDSVSEMANDIKDVAVSTARVYAAGAQGLAMGVAGGVVSIADMAYNGGAYLVGSDSRIDMSGSVVNAIKEHGLQPRNDAERWVMAGGQVVGEVGVLVGGIVLTGGAAGVVAGGAAGAAAGAALTTARATAVGSRIVNVGSAISRVGASATVHGSKLGATAQSGAGVIMQTGQATTQIGNAINAAGSSAPLLTRISSMGSSTASSWGTTGISSTWGLLNPIAGKTAMALEIGFLGHGTFEGYEQLTQEAFDKNLGEMRKSLKAAYIDNISQAEDIQSRMNNGNLTVQQHEELESELEKRFQAHNIFTELRTEFANETITLDGLKTHLSSLKDLDLYQENGEISLDNDTLLQGQVTEPRKDVALTME